MARTLYACQRCGEEVGEGEQNHGCCPFCGCRGLDPVGECPEAIADIPAEDK